MGELLRPADLTGQETALRAFTSAVATGRVAGAYLLHGPEGVGRSLGAAIFANALLCDRPDGLAACGLCRPCRWNAEGTHPDLLCLAGDTGPRFDDDGDAARAGVDRFTRAARRAARPGPRKSIQVRTLRRVLELLSLAAAGGGAKVAVIDAFDEVEDEGTAALLKSLEEAPPRTTFLLLARGLDGVPDTILSRCQRVRFRPLPPDVVRRIVRARGGDAVSALSETALDLLVRLGQGSPGRVLAATRFGVAGVPADALADLGRAPAPPEALFQWMREDTKDLEGQRERTREVLALALLRARDAWSPASDGVAAAVRGALESLDANVSPEWVLRGLWVRAARAHAAGA